MFRMRRKISAGTQRALQAVGIGVCLLVLGDVIGQAWRRTAALDECLQLGGIPFEQAGEMTCIEGLPTLSARAKQ